MKASPLAMEFAGQRSIEEKGSKIADASTYMRKKEGIEGKVNSKRK